MKKHKKILLAVLLTTVVLAGSISGAVLASDNDNGDNEAPEFGTFIERVLELYQEKTGTIVDKEALQASLHQAREEMKPEHPRVRLHGRLFDDEMFTQEQRDEIEAWLEARPEFPTDDFKEWLESKPELLPDNFKDWLESRPDFLEDEMAAWFDTCPEALPFKFGIHGRIGPRIFGHLDKCNGFHMFGYFDSDSSE